MKWYFLTLVIFTGYLFFLLDKRLNTIEFYLSLLLSDRKLIAESTDEVKKEYRKTDA